MDFELVLAVEKVLPADRIAAWLTENDAHCIEPSEQEIGIGVARSGSRKGRATGLGKLVVQDPIHVVHLITPLERMPAPDPAHGIPKVPVLVFLLVRVHGAEIKVSLYANRDSFAIDTIGNGDT